MKNGNIVFLSLENLYTKELAKLVAEKLQMNFIDLKNDISKNFIKNNLLNSLDEKLLDKCEKETLTNVFKKNNQIILCTVDLINKIKPLKKIKQKSKIIYIKLKKQDISTDYFSYNTGHAFDTEDKFCQNISDLIINYKKSTTIEEIIEKVRQIYDKESK